VTVGISGDLLRIEIVGESFDHRIVACFQEALAAGAMRPNMLTLVDLSGFNGGVDRAAMHAIVDLAPWGSETGRPSRVAYVTKSAWFAAMLKLASVLFPKTAHRQFSDVADAMQWLQLKD